MSRFEEVSSEEIKRIVDNATLINTKRSTKYGLRIFIEWLDSPGGKKFSKSIEEMSKQELNDCLKSFYTSARKQDGSYYKTSSMKSIRAAIDRFLRSPPHCKQFSIIGDPAFTEANQVLDAFVKDLRKTGKIAGVVHKKPITKQQFQRLYECGELGQANSTNVLYFGQRGRENQRQMKSNMLVFRKTPQGKEYCELNKDVAGSVPSTKNQGGLHDHEDDSDGKIFALEDSPSPNHQKLPVPS
ncbi:hypothetical protein ABFA07_020841 [Porites harrisoni]